MRYGLNHWGGFGSLVRLAMRNPVEEPGNEYITDTTHPLTLRSSAPPGEPGYVMVGDTNEGAPFYVLDNQLFQVQNSSSILYVNVVNTTDVNWHNNKPGEDPAATNLHPKQRVMSKSIHMRRPSFRLTLSHKMEGIRGEWMWDEENEMIAFQSRGSNKVRGKFYSCKDRGMYVDLDEGTPFPIFCQLMKLW